MQSSRSASRAASRSAPTGVAGLSVTPAAMPSSWIRSSVWCRCGQVSTCTVHESAPAFANSASWRSGRSIIRCTSIVPPRSCTRSANDETTLRPERDHGDEMAVHHVDVERACAGVEQLDDLAAERAEVGREDRRHDLGRRGPAHRPSLGACQAPRPQPRPYDTDDDRLPRDRPSRRHRKDRLPARRLADARAHGRHRPAPRPAIRSSPSTPSAPATASSCSSPRARRRARRSARPGRSTPPSWRSSTRSRSAASAPTRARW